MTTVFLIYLVKVAISILLMMGLFKLALAADHSFARNRFYLIGAVLWSIFVPILTMQWSSQPISAIQSTYTISIPEIVITPNITSDSPLWGDPSTILLTIYLTGVAIFLLKMMGSYLRVLYMIASAKNYTIDSYNIKVTRAAIAPFAFFGWIVFPEKLINHRDLTKMLLHERVHSRQLHSIDLLLGEFFAVFQWFNPASWMLKRLIVENHEYTADRTVIDLGVNSYEYQVSLVNATVGREVVPVNHFSLILIKKRITMINKNHNSGWLRVKSLLLPAAFLAALGLTSFTVEFGANQISNNQQKVSITQNVPSPKMETTPKVEVQKPLATKEDDEVFQSVETMPTFGKAKTQAEGIREMMEFLSKNIVYPPQAAENGKQGTVYVQFIVTKIGKITDVKIIRGVDPLLDAEAVRVAKMMPNWTPGMQDGKKVAVQFVMPVKFVLDTDKNDASEANLIIVNGNIYKGDLNSIDTNDILSISVIKDPNIASKYGEAGKNGVIEITLKKGIKVPTTLKKLTVFGYSPAK